MTTPIHKADFSFIFSVSIGSSFSFNLCPSDLLLLLQPSDVRQHFCIFSSSVYHLLSHLDWRYCFSWFLTAFAGTFSGCSTTNQRKTQWNTFVWQVQCSTVTPASLAKVYYRCAALWFPDSSMDRRKYLPFHVCKKFEEDYKKSNINHLF